MSNVRLHFTHKMVRRGAILCPTMIMEPKEDVDSLCVIGAITLFFGSSLLRCMVLSSWRLCNSVW